MHCTTWECACSSETQKRQSRHSRQLLVSRVIHLVAFVLCFFKENSVCALSVTFMQEFERGILEMRISGRVGKECVHLVC